MIFLLPQGINNMSSMKCYEHAYSYAGFLMMVHADFENFFKSLGIPGETYSVWFTYPCMCADDCHYSMNHMIGDADPEGSIKCWNANIGPMYLEVFTPYRDIAAMVSTMLNLKYH